MLILICMIAYAFVGGMTASWFHQTYKPEKDFWDDPDPFCMAIFWPVALPCLLGYWLISPFKKTKEKE